jgi:hypothetical protein
LPYIQFDIYQFHVYFFIYGRSLGPTVIFVLDETPTSAPVLPLIELRKTSSSLPYSGAGMQKKRAPPLLFAFAGIPCSAPSPKLWPVGDLLQG